MRLPTFDLPTTDGGRVTDVDVRGRVLYLSRHTGCYICQHHLRTLLERRGELQALGSDVVVFFPARVAHVRAWMASADLPDDLVVGIDADCTLYEALGTRSGSYLHNLHKQARHLWNARGQIGRWRLTADDMTRMGADVVVDAGGDMTFVHVCEDPGDRAAPATLVAAVRDLHLEELHAHQA